MGVLGWRDLSELQWFSLDENHWATLVENVVNNSVNIEATSSFSGAASVIRKTTVSISSTSDVSALDKAIRNAVSNIAATSDVSATAYAKRQASSAIEATSIVSSAGYILVKDSTVIEVGSESSADGHAIRYGKSDIIGTTDVSATGKIIPSGHIVYGSSDIFGNCYVTAKGKIRSPIPANPYANDLGVTYAIYPLSSRPHDTKHIEINFVYNDTKYDKLYYDEFKKEITIEYRNVGIHIRKPSIKLEKMGREKRGPKVVMEKLEPVHG